MTLEIRLGILTREHRISGLLDEIAEYRVSGSSIRGKREFNLYRANYN